MIDTIKIKLTSDTTGKLSEYMYSETSNNEKSNSPNSTVYNCCIANMKISCKEVDGKYVIRIKGSLHKFFNGDNFTKFRFKDIRKAIEVLQSKLGLDLMSGEIRRLDIGTNIKVKKPVQAYHLLLAETADYKKDTYGDHQSVSFRKGHIALSFYDKIKELDSATKKKYRTSIAKHKNVIRYELKLLEGLAKSLRLSQKELYVCDLLNAKIYSKMVRLWYKEYRAITKLPSVTSPMFFKNFHHYLESEGILGIGGLNEAFTTLHVWSTFTKNPRQTRYSYKKRLRVILNNVKHRDNLISEINRKIKKTKIKELSSI